MKLGKIREQKIIWESCTIFVCTVKFIKLVSGFGWEGKVLEFAANVEFWLGILETLTAVGNHTFSLLKQGKKCIVHS